VCCSVLQCVDSNCFQMTSFGLVYLSVLQCAAVCCGMLQCVTVCCRVLQSVAVCCSVFQCVAVYCSVLQCAVAVSISTLQIGFRV